MVLLILTFVFIVFFALFIKYFILFDDNGFSESTSLTTTSPDGQFAAKLVVKDCGATTRPGGVLLISENPSKENDSSWEKVFVYRGGHPVNTRWGNGSLVITASIPQDDVFLRMSSWDTVSIIYE